MTDKEKRLAEIDREYNPETIGMAMRDDIEFLLTELRSAWEREKIMKEALELIQIECIITQKAAPENPGYPRIIIQGACKEALAKVEGMK